MERGCNITESGKSEALWILSGCTVYMTKQDSQHIPQLPERERRVTTSGKSGQCSQMSRGHVTFEIEARLVRQQSKSNKTLILPCLPKPFHIQNGRSDDLSGCSKITHQRSPHSWRTPWPSKACSLSPSPEKGDEGERKEGRQKCGRVNYTLALKCDNYQVISILQGEHYYLSEKNINTNIHTAFWTESGIHKVKRKTESMNGTDSKYGTSKSTEVDSWCCQVELNGTQNLSIHIRCSVV